MGNPTYEQCNEISYRVYSVDNNDKVDGKNIAYNQKNPLEFNGQNEVHSGDQKFRVLYSSDNPDSNGFQGMAVAPIVNDVVDTSQVTIAYAGTNQSDPKDLLTDTESVVANSGGFAGGSGVGESQLKSAQDFAKCMREVA
ncbi:MAG: hypothetical protein LBI13_04800 [Streptococcaceae bacterium]|jgi:hypothetical protein|nr:hypothetical protein [Streptococcaceae bacterium]